MDGHNVVKLHSFSVMPANTPERPTRHPLHGHTTIPVFPVRPATGILRLSWPYSAQPPYYIHATDQLPQRSTRHNRKPYTCFSVDKPYCIRYTILYTIQNLTNGMARAWWRMSFW